MRDDGPAIVDRCPADVGRAGPQPRRAAANAGSENAGIVAAARVLDHGEHRVGPAVHRGSEGAGCRYGEIVVRAVKLDIRPPAAAAGAVSGLLGAGRLRRVRDGSAAVIPLRQRAAVGLRYDRRAVKMADNGVKRGECGARRGRRRWRRRSAACGQRRAAGMAHGAIAISKTISGHQARPTMSAAVVPAARM